MGKISIQEVTKSYRGRELFSPVSMELSVGDRLAVTGSSGIGKTTFLKILAGLIVPDRGQVISSNGLRRGMVFQENYLLEEFTVLENLQSVAEELSRRELEEYGAQLSMSDYFDERVSQLSGGMKRRVALLRALVYRPDLLLLDEVLREVDEENRQKMVRAIRSVSEDSIVVFVTHEKRDIKDLEATAIFQLGEGRFSET